MTEIKAPRCRAARIHGQTVESAFHLLAISPANHVKRRVANGAA